jgi:hypothetical protein
MKLYNTIIIHDVYVIANDAAEARETVKTWIKEGLQPSEETALEARDQRNVRQSWRDQKPLVGGSVTDKEFEGQIKGRTTIEIFEHLYMKR